MGPWSFAKAQPPEDIEQRMRPSSGIERVPASWWDDWPMWLMLAGIGVLGAAAGAALAMKIVNHRRNASSKRLPAHNWALQELARLEAARHELGGTWETYINDLSAIVRRYLEQRFQLAATKQTSPEFLQAMRSAACLRHDQQALLHDFLEQCDLAKFAGVTPSAKQSQALAITARRFIEETSIG
jgi:hypothetical protein